MIVKIDLYFVQLVDDQLASSFSFYLSNSAYACLAVSSIHSETMVNLLLGDASNPNELMLMQVDLSTA